MQWIGGALGLALVAATSGGLDTGTENVGLLTTDVKAGSLALAALATLAAAIAAVTVARPWRARLATTG